MTENWNTTVFPSDQRSEQKVITEINRHNKGPTNDDISTQYIRPVLLICDGFNMVPCRSPTTWITKIIGLTQRFEMAVSTHSRVKYEKITVTPEIWNHVFAPVFGRIHVFSHEKLGFLVKRKTYWFGVNRPSGCGVAVSARFQEPLSRTWACPLYPHGQMTITLRTYRPRQFQWTWFGVNRPSGCWVPASVRSHEPLTCPWVCPLCPNGQMTIPLHTYRPRPFQWTWFGVNRSSGCGVQASARFQEVFSCPWACPLCPYGQMTMTLHTYRPRWFQWTWFGVHRPSGCWVMASANFGRTNGRRALHNPPFFFGKVGGQN